MYGSTRGRLNISKVVRESSLEQLTERVSYYGEVPTLFSSCLLYNGDSTIVDDRVDDMLILK